MTIALLKGLSFSHCAFDASARRFCCSSCQKIAGLYCEPWSQNWLSIVVGS